MTEDQKPKKVMPKGGRRGGSVFPRMTLTDAVKAAKKLVSKTHTGPQEKAAIFAVVGAKGGKGEVKISALKQYGFMGGDTSSKFSASDLAKRLIAAPEDETAPLIRKAALTPQPFLKMFNVFHGEEVTRAKLKQGAAELKVHPDATEEFVDIYIEAMQTSGLAKVVGDKVRHLSQSDLTDVQSIDVGDDELETDVIQDNDADPEEDAGTGDTGQTDQDNDDQKRTADVTPSGAGPRAVFHVNVSLDSSLDTEKLEKQLALLKRYGAI